MTGTARGVLDAGGRDAEIDRALRVPNVAAAVAAGLIGAMLRDRYGSAFTAWLCLPALYWLAGLAGLRSMLGLPMLMLRVVDVELYHRDRAVVDPLTGCLNRRALQTRVAELEQQSRVVGGSFSVIVFDLDRFKDVNAAVEEVPITASVGVAAGRSPLDIARLIESADRRMYEAKQRGRNTTTA